MSRWTIKELNETDDITFAMSILAERRNALSNLEAPLAIKLNRAHNTLDRIRGGTPLMLNGDEKEYDRISFRMHMERNDQELLSFLTGMLNAQEEEIDLSGYAVDDILADGDIVGSILKRFGKCESNEEENMKYAIEYTLGELRSEAKEKTGA